MTMKPRFVPSPTLMVHLGVVLLGAFLTMGFATKVHLAPAPAGVAAHELRLQATAPFRMAVGPGATLPAGSRWRAAGSIAQGTVYRPLNRVVLLDGQRVDEAWPVIQAGQLQGFFLPAEARFSPVRQAVPLALAPARA
jgi:hypothetical protein